MAKGRWGNREGGGGFEERGMVSVSREERAVIHGKKSQGFHHPWSF